MTDTATRPKPQGNPNEAINAYLVKEIAEATPDKLVLKVYDAAIRFCGQKNLEKTNLALGVLIDGLNFQDEQAREISVGLLKLYQFAQEQMRKKNYDLTLTILKDLRSSWVDAFAQEKKG
jgi:flagellar protein FliS